jgi:hypothetical protein
MPFFIINVNCIYPVEYSSYEQAGADCEPGEFVYMADSIEILEEILESAFRNKNQLINSRIFNRK